MRLHRNQSHNQRGKQVVVVFTSNNARIFINPTDYSDFLGYDIVLNPDLSKVTGVPTHYWKIENETIVPMNQTERLLRDDNIKSRGIDNKVTFKPRLIVKEPEDLSGFFLSLVCCVLVAMVAALFIILTVTKKIG